MQLFERKESRNTMSYLIAVKGRKGTVITSDSYSTYLNRTLKDDAYQKLHELVKERCYIGLTGMNEVMVDEKLVDINTTLSDYFSNVTLETVEQQIDTFNLFLKDSCDKYCMDISYVLVFDNILYDVSILNNAEIQKRFVPFYEYGVFVLGENEYKEWSIHNIDRNIISDSLQLLKAKCEDIVANVIELEAKQYPENQRVVGGAIQQVCIPIKTMSDASLRRKIV